MATVHFIGGEKGGVGKSLVARLLAQYFIDRKLPFLGFDSDRSHGALLRFYTGFASPVAIDRFESLDLVLEAAAEDPARRIVVDLAAQTHGPLVRWLDESGVLELAEELGVSIRYWHVMDSGKDSVDLLARWLDRFGESSQVELVIVRNSSRGDDFDIFDKSGQKERALNLGARIISIPRLHEPVMTKIDERSTSFWAAANSDDKAMTGLGMLERQRAKMWLRRAYEALEPLSL